MAGAVSLASVLGLVSPAHADTNIRGTEGWNTDKMLMSLCNGRTDYSWYTINVDTGQVQWDYAKGGLRGGASENKLWHPKERFEGWCTYPQASSWTWTGNETKVSDTLVNCSSGSQLSQAMQVNGTTTTTTSNSVGGQFGVEWNVIEKVLGLQAAVNYSHTWSYANAKGWSTTTTLTVPQRRVGWLTMRPEMRTVRSNPVFHIKKYTYENAQGIKINIKTYRGRGYADIKSQGAFYDAKANILDSNGKPKGQYVARDRAVNGSDHC
ncbi:hypothetical protein OG352_38995 [Streptomyces sp. NBC_01485]|uniref:hypothetical protein n=1 Tax=Streptomyces sp. NBC_01485 TaxID=2903884 RepID=UPI002E363384|nr:hypothetical protein [Streptomyces sp. NBC_01485]